MDKNILQNGESKLSQGYVEEIFDIIKNSANDEFWLNFGLQHPYDSKSEYYFRLGKDKYIIVDDL